VEKDVVKIILIILAILFAIFYDEEWFKRRFK